MLATEREHRIQKPRIIPRHVDGMLAQPATLRIAQPLGGKLDEHVLFVRVQPGASGQRKPVHRGMKRRAQVDVHRRTEVRARAETPVDLEQVRASRRPLDQILAGKDARHSKRLHQPLRACAKRRHVAESHDRSRRHRPSVRLQPIAGEISEHLSLPCRDVVIADVAVDVLLQHDATGRIGF